LKIKEAFLGMEKSVVSWQRLEQIVRRLAEAKFSAIARAEDIAGVKCDCVLRPADGSAVIIEITKERSIDKLRTDLAKFNTIRPHFFSQNIFPRCFFITLSNPTPALIAGGIASHVTVQSVTQFVNSMAGFGDYLNLRKRLPFGSAIDLYTGAPDDRSYVGVEYTASNGESYNSAKISEALIRGKTIVLIGDYGTGKSRCVKEVFSEIINGFKQHYHAPVAINLRDNWGLKRAPEIINRHFTDMGLGDRVPDIMKVAFVPGLIYLLDGFDEIGAQTWSDDPTKLVSIRRQSLVGVKDLIARAQGGVLITGREHYFNNDLELIECLGIQDKSAIFLRCQQELNDGQFTELIGGVVDKMPAWVPKKPLIGIVIREIDPKSVKRILETTTGQADFWDLLLQAFCEREAKINPILDSSIIRTLYDHIGRLSRTTQTSLGPISIKQINEAFEKTTGRPPTDESAIILQRLPGLSRIGAESLDRQFVDTFILDGLKAEDLLAIYSEAQADVLEIAWKHPIEDFGATFLAARIGGMHQESGMVAYVKRHLNSKNRILLSDLIASLFRCERLDIDFGGQTFRDGHFSHLTFADSAVSNLRLQECVFDSVDVTDAEPADMEILDSVILRAAGVTGYEHLPQWIRGCTVEEYQNVNTLAAIRSAGLSVAQTFLLSSLRKLFLQPGAGRKHSSMYKGYGDSNSKKICEKVISLLMKEGFCTRVRGATEDLYIPERSLMGRAKAITSEMTQSKDAVWLKASRLDPD
jgi:hypothetical protein